MKGSVLISGLLAAWLILSAGAFAAEIPLLSSDVFLRFVVEESPAGQALAERLIGGSVRDEADLSRFLNTLHEDRFADLRQKFSERLELFKGEARVLDLRIGERELNDVSTKYFSLRYGNEVEFLPFQRQSEDLAARFMNFAPEEPLVHSIKAYPSPSEESVVRVTTAKIALADYDLLKADFPELHGRSQAEIDAWILDHAGYISMPQAMNPVGEEMHTPIEIDRQQIIRAFRPEGYRRGLVFKADSPTRHALLDGKGFGARDPRPGINSNGLLPLPDGVREFVMENTVRRVLTAETAGKFATVKTYAVIDWGFDIKLPGGRTTPAGAVLRRPHTRETWNFNSNLKKDVALDIELILRKYGITSTGLSESLRRQAQVPYDLINIQGKGLAGGRAVIVDFGTFVRVPDGYRFTRPLAVRESVFTSAAVLENTVGANRSVGVLSGVLAENDARFLSAPIYKNAVPADVFGPSQPEGSLIPEDDLVTTNSARVAGDYRRALAEGESPEQGRRFFESYFQSVIGRLPF